MCKSCIDAVEIHGIESSRIVCGLKVYYVTSYTGNMRKLIRGLKYHRKKDLAKNFAEFLSLYWKNLAESEEEFEIVPVPLYKNRQNKRGYNHMELVALEFSKLTGYKVNTSLISRIKDTKPQYKLSMIQRRENLKGAFSVNRNAYNGKRILLIDDICTTGTTLEEMIKTLKGARVNNLYAIVGACPESLTVN